MRYAVERALLDDQPLVTLRDDAGRRVRIACHGAALIGFNRPEWADAVRLEPRAGRVFRCGIEAH